MNEYITVKQFAAAAGVSSQRIYQRLDTNLKPFVRVVNGQKMLSSEGLKLFEIQPLAQDLNKPLTELEQALELSRSENEALKAENTSLTGSIQDLEQALENEKEKSEKLTAKNAALNENIQALEQALAKSPLLLDDLRADKSFLQSQLTEKDNQIKALTAEIEQERKERQTILAELLALRGQKKIEVKAQPRPSAPRGGGGSTSVSSSKWWQRLLRR